MLVQVEYDDGTRRVIEDMDEAEFSYLCEQFGFGEQFVILGKIALKLTDVRTICIVSEIKTPEINVLTTDDWGFVDAETRQWLRLNGIKFDGVNE